MHVEIGTVCRPALGERVPGDAYAVVRGEESLLVSVADGLGHGEHAAEAAQAFIDFVQKAPSGPLDSLMSEASRHIAGTRGAAAAIVRLDFASGRMECCGVGNIHFQALADRPIHPVCAPGIVGHRIRKVLRFEFDLPDDLLFSLASDGLSTRIHLEKHADAGVQEIADMLLEEHGKSHDDATCVVVRYSAG